MILTFSRLVVGWAMQKVHPLLRLRGAPEETEGVRRYAIALLRIAHPQLVFLRCLDLDLEGERLMDVLRVPVAEIDALSASNPALFAALTEKRPPTNWIRNPSGEIPSVFVRAALRLDPNELEHITVTKEKIKPIDWLIEAALDTSQFFPELPVMRRTFGKKLPCADGENYESQKEN